MEVRSVAVEVQAEGEVAGVPDFQAPPPAVEMEVAPLLTAQGAVVVAAVVTVAAVAAEGQCLRNTVVRVADFGVVSWLDAEAQSIIHQRRFSLVLMPICDMPVNIPKIASMSNESNFAPFTFG